MGLLMEYIVVLVYIIAGVRIPRLEDADDDHFEGGNLVGVPPQKYAMQPERTHDPQAAYPMQGYADQSWQGRTVA